ncbi:DHHC palmitoyltransferase-domain-containing protein [Gongronella butleri]|nr:DHHC palmitoyltransferase-domain-containing protein [Gongronella butleri]
MVEPTSLLNAIADTSSPAPGTNDHQNEQQGGNSGGGANGNNTPPPSSSLSSSSSPSGKKEQLIELHHELLASSTDNLDTTTTTAGAPRLPGKRVRNYEVFPGNSIFFCGGRMVTSSSHWAFVVALFILIVPCTLFAVFVCPFLWYNMSPAIPIVFGYVFIIALVNMIKTSWTDPGIIPRGLDPTPTLETFDDHSSIWTQPFPADRCVKIKDDMWNLKYCETCKIYRPPRASHCRQCDNCVENEDHHCIWLNNCAPVSFVLAIIGTMLLWAVGGLTSYHCHLVWKGLTTHEKLRASFINPHRPEQPNPYGQGNPMINIMQVLCRPQPKRYATNRCQRMPV